MSTRWRHGAIQLLTVFTLRTGVAARCLTRRRAGAVGWRGVIGPAIPLEKLTLEQMASGNLSLRLTERVAWEDFPEYAEAIAAILDGHIVSRADSVVERVYSMQVGDDSYWIAFDDFAAGVSVDSRTESASAALEAHRGRLLEWRSAHPT